MLLNLLKRDLKLHWDALVVPLLILVLVMGAMALANEGAALVGLIMCAVLFVPILPMALQVREAQTGTLGDLLVLPVSRASIVNLRYLEVFLFAMGLLALAHVGTWLALSTAAHQVVPFKVMDRTGAFFVGMLLIFLFAYPMPFALRWGGKGLGIAFGILVGGLMGISTASAFFPKFEAVYGRTMIRFIEHLLGDLRRPHSGHPGQMALLFLALFALSYGLSRRAFATRDL